MSKPEQEIIKKCSCGNTYNLDQFLELPQPPAGQWQFIEPGFGLILRDCSCGSTIALELKHEIMTGGE